MVVFKCKMCAGTLSVENGETVGTCDYCGRKQTVLKSRNEVVQNLYNRANNLRLKCEFDKAEQLYEKILIEDETEAEAHWGIVLCRYGIEYVEDPKTYTRIPTCHRTLYDAVTTDVNYLSAILNADILQKEIYEKEAKEIDKIQKDILNVVKNEEPFDIFICYKEKDDTGKRTVDSVFANDIYYELTKAGYKVFYAAITLEEKLGQEYEPYIFAALNSAKVMLVIGSKPEYFDSVWVKNEWSRFFKLMKTDRDRSLFPCYKDMDPYDLPDEFAHLQAQDMGKIGFINDIVRGIKKVIPKDAPAQTEKIVVAETKVNSTISEKKETPAPSNRKQIMLGDGTMYEGEVFLDIPHGFGKADYANGDRYEGEFRKGKREGRGICLFSNKNKYEGEWTADKMHGKGTLLRFDGSSWSGEFKDGACWNGNGVLKTDNGDKYDGAFENGTYNGQGSMFWVDGRKYEGAFKDGKIHGHGIFYHTADEKWEGEYRDGSMWSGKGIIKFTNGDLYDGEYINGTIEGYGKYSWSTGSKYTGQWKANKRNGQGTVYWKNGETWTGEFKEDLCFTGDGVVQYKTGDKYEGAYLDGKAVGRGIYYCANGDRYEGDFKDGKSDGMGTYYWKDGRKYTGEFKDGKRSGQGVCTFVDGNKYEGTFENGNMNGQGVFCYANGDTWQGEYKDGIRWNGKGVDQYESGEKYDGQIVSGKRHGYGVYYYSTGDKYEGDWNENKRHGRGEYTSDGNIFIAEYKNDVCWEGRGVLRYCDSNKKYYEGGVKEGKKDGKGIYYYSDGSRFDGTWENDLKNGPGTFFADGKSWSGEYKAGKCQSGLGMDYYGGLKYIGEWKDGLPHGNGTMYLSDGQNPWYTGEWKKGQKHGNGVMYFPQSNYKLVGVWKKDIRKSVKEEKI